VGSLSFGFSPLSMAMDRAQDIPEAAGQTPEPKAGEAGGILEAGHREIAEAGGQTPEPHGTKRTSEHLGKGARRILAHTCSGFVQEFRLADFLPEEWVTSPAGGQTPVFDAHSVAHHQVLSEDLEGRSSIMVAQFLARDVLNQALMTLGRPLEDSLHQAIAAALENSVITERQARCLGCLNRSANEAKHGMWFRNVLKEEASSSSSHTKV